MFAQVEYSLMPAHGSEGRPTSGPLGQPVQDSDGAQRRSYNEQTRQVSPDVLKCKHDETPQL